MRKALIDVRVPTYRRPALLRRALCSLVNQHHNEWSASVIDDSPTREGSVIVRELADNRITYYPNPVNLGISANLDGAFSRPAHTGSAFACVLEDDNYYLPDHLADSIKLLEASGCDVMLRDHLIERVNHHDGSGEIGPETQYCGQYHEGPIDQLRLFAALFYSIGATNAGLFWRTHKGLDFSTRAYVDDVVWQERIRTLCIDRPVYMAMRPTVVWRDNGGNSWRTVPKGPLWHLNNVRWATIERKIYSALYSHLLRMNAEHFIWAPPAGEFSAARERVFHRVGLAVPSDLMKIGASARSSLAFKRCVAMVIGAATQHYCAIRFDPVSGRLTTAAT